MAQIDLSIILPCYNEGDNIPVIISSFQEVLPTDISTEILLVNNGSTDHSQEVLEAELASLPSPHPFKVVHVPNNKGYGYGILSGLKAATGDTLAWTHADMQTSPKDVFEAYSIFKSKNDPMTIIKGKRKNRPFSENFFTAGMQWVVLFALGRNINDINAQPKLFSRTFYSSHINEHAPHDFSLDLFLLYQADKYGRTISFPVFFNKRLHGEAKGGGSFKTRIKLIKRTLSYIFELRKTLAKLP
jgi:glycosyltransferase involved in cell wall biosynthesis